ncbi:hypothetical protein Zm00014a_008709 [Zea mays]|uniref:Uncharacterized protein n=2 Tax=Zea mays TaxID=4577 RepID=A0A3L6FQU0_MAIZE|nr:hypothetical protein Zm00014a_008709 [Zea mays]
MVGPVFLYDLPPSREPEVRAPQAASPFFLHALPSPMRGSSASARPCSPPSASASRASLGALVLAAEGKFFSNGYDLAWARAGPAPAPGHRLFAMRAAMRATFRGLVADLLALPVPTVTTVMGHAAGAGCALALAHDAIAMRASRGFLCMSEGSLNDVGSVDVFSWIRCLDLRTLAVLTNSTLSSSSDPHNISFHYLIPEGGNDKLSYFKLKVLLPDSDLTVTSQKQIKDKLNVATPKGNFLWLFHIELSPFLIAKSQLSKKRFVYIAADSIIKGKVEDLGRMELGGYAIGAVEDCSKRLSDYISMDVLSAIQRAGATFSWVPKEPYNEDACLLDFDVLLMEPRKLEKTLITSIMWWATGCLQQCRY